MSICNLSHWKPHIGYLKSNQKFQAPKMENGLPWWVSGKEPACNAGAARDADLIPRLGRCPGGGRGNPLQYSCLKNPMGRGSWQAPVHRVTKSQTQLKQLSTHKTENKLRIKVPGFIKSSKRIKKQLTRGRRRKVRDRHNICARQTPLQIL